jgi:hypothetical protein
MDFSGISGMINLDKILVSGIKPIEVILFLFFPRKLKMGHGVHTDHVLTPSLDVCGRWFKATKSSRSGGWNLIIVNRGLKFLFRNTLIHGRGLQAFEIGKGVNHLLDRIHTNNVLLERLVVDKLKELVFIVRKLRMFVTVRHGFGAKGDQCFQNGCSFGVVVCGINPPNNLNHIFLVGNTQDTEKVEDVQLPSGPMGRFENGVLEKDVHIQILRIILVGNVLTNNSQNGGNGTGGPHTERKNGLSGFHVYVGDVQSKLLSEKNNTGNTVHDEVLPGICGISPASCKSRAAVLNRESISSDILPKLAP